jgi:hypothetical protein
MRQLLVLLPHPGRSAWVAGLVLLGMVMPVPVLAQGTSGPVVGDSRVGYVDGAIPGNQLRLRYDSSYNTRRPSRAEFIWPKGGPFNPGPPKAEARVDYQDFITYLEIAPGERVSAFVEFPVRLLNPVINDNTDGPGDMNAGFKYAFLATEQLVSSFQLRTWIPTGDGDRGLGTNHVSLEPGILLYTSLTDRLSLEGEFRTWIPIGGTDFAGEILRYGLGLHYDVVRSCDVRVTPVAEVVGWTVLDGRAGARGPTGVPFVEDASGDTIVNAKLGLRFGLQDLGDIYAGYGRALTGDRWYENTFRIELRLIY